MTTARDIMNAGVTCVGEHETLTAAAQYMREHDIGALPICGDDDRLHGMLTAHGPRQLATSDHPPARKALSASIGGTQCVMRSRLGGSPGLW